MLPFLNGGAMFPAAVRSILQQSHANLELLLCDDGSTDGSLEWARAIGDPRVRVWSDGKTRGLASRLNECIDRASGSLIARMDADDISYPERLRQQANFLAAHPEIDLVGCQVVIFGEEGQPLAKRSVPLAHAEITANPALGFGIVHPTWLARREWYRKHYYDPKAIRFEDVELLLRSHTASRFANLPQVLHGYRELRGGFWKRCKSRVGRVRHLKSQRETLGSALYYRAALAEAVKLPSDAALTAFSFRYAMLRAREARLSAAEITKWETVYDRLFGASLTTPVTTVSAAGRAEK
jgi:glycosyltransferase involved in cell wall biosynthesis